MHRKERGLPTDFGLSVPDGAVKRTPVSLDDYLEREIGAERPAVPRPPRPIARPLETVAPPRVEAATATPASSVIHPRPVQGVAPRQAPTFPQRFRPRPAPVKAPRGQGKTGYSRCPTSPVQHDGRNRRPGWPEGETSGLPA